MKKEVPQGRRQPFDEEHQVALAQDVQLGRLDPADV
jgi:hypothetical protein